MEKKWLTLLLFPIRVALSQEEEYCPDSPSWHKASEPSKNCAWVSQHTPQRCDTKGQDRSYASYSCPTACKVQTSGVCDSSTWRKRSSDWKDCAWVSTFARRRCDVVGEDGSTARESCYHACGTVPVERQKFESCDALFDTRSSAAKTEEGGSWDSMAPRALREVVGGSCTRYDVGPSPIVEPDVEEGQDGDGGEDFGSGDEEFSETNSQEAGVAEPDIVKTHGNVIYTASATGNGTEDCRYRLSIVRDDDDDGIELVGSVPLEELVTTPIEMLIANDVLLLIGSTNLYYEDEGDMDLEENFDFWWWPSYEPAVVLLWFDVSDPSTPKLLRRQVREGSYVDARRIDEFAYIVVARGESWGVVPRAAVPFFRDENFVNDDEIETTFASNIRQEETTYHAAAQGPTVPSSACEDVSFSSPVFSELAQFTSIVAVRLGVEDAVEMTTTETIATRADATVYSSRRHMYLMQTDFVHWLEDVEWPTQYRTVIFQFSLDGMSVSLQTSFSVPGMILNQFALSETSDGRYLRVATTSRPANGDWTNTSNGVFVFDTTSGRQVGAVSGLAPGESIMSARFFETRCYLVTFVVVDPLFVISLDDPKNPAVLGELKVEGFSSYLHPLNDTHLIGLGREVAVVNETWGITAVEQGIQLQLFDVADDSDPKLAFEPMIFGDRGSYSDALSDHKAFQLFDERSTFFAFPASLTSLDAMNELGEDGMNSVWTSGLQIFQGVLLFQIVEDGSFELAANITHLPADFFTPTWVPFYEGSDEGYWESSSDTESSGYHIKRTLARGDQLFSISSTAITKTTLDAASDLLGRVELHDGDVLAELHWAIA